MNRALPYYYFGSRDQLLLALYEQHDQAFNERVNAALDITEDLEGTIDAILAAWMSDLVEHAPELNALARSKNGSGELEARRDQVTISNGRRLSEMLATALGQASGLPATELSSRFTAFAMAGLGALEQQPKASGRTRPR